MIGVPFIPLDDARTQTKKAPQTMFYNRQHTTSTRQQAPAPRPFAQDVPAYMISTVQQLMDEAEPDVLALSHSAVSDDVCNSLMPIQDTQRYLTALGRQVHTRLCKSAGYTVRYSHAETSAAPFFQGGVDYLVVQHNKRGKVFDTAGDAKGSGLHLPVEALYVVPNMGAHWFVRGASKRYRTLLASALYKSEHFVGPARQLCALLDSLETLLKEDVFSYLPPWRTAATWKCALSKGCDTGRVFGDMHSAHSDSSITIDDSTGAEEDEEDEEEEEDVLSGHEDATSCSSDILFPEEEVHEEALMRHGSFCSEVSH